MKNKIKEKEDEDFSSNLFYPKDNNVNIFDNSGSSSSSSDSSSSSSSSSDNTKSIDTDNHLTTSSTTPVKNPLFNENEQTIQKTFDWIFKYRCIANNVNPTFENLTLVNALIPLTSKPNQLHSPTPLLLFSYSQTLINSLKDSEPSQTHYENLLLWIETLEIKRRSDVYHALKKLNSDESDPSKNKKDSGKKNSKKTISKSSSKNKEEDDVDGKTIVNHDKKTNEYLPELGHFSTDSLLEDKIEKRFENAYLLLKKQIFIMELQKKPFNPVNCKVLLNKLFPVNEDDTEAIILKHYPSPRLDYASVIYSMEEYLQQQKASSKKNNRKKKNSKLKELEKNDTPIKKFEKTSSWKQSKVALEFYLNSIRKCLY